jgi:hypothetical protein
MAETNDGQPLSHRWHRSGIRDCRRRPERAKE